jgi:hypothetical protein
MKDLTPVPRRSDRHGPSGFNRSTTGASSTISDMVERIVGVMLGAAAPLIGLALRGTRRNRLRHQIQTYTALSETLAENDPDSANELRQLVRESVHRLVDAERTALRRRFDTASAIAVVLFVVPAVAIVAWAWGRDSWWHWPAITIASVWALIWSIVGISQLWTSQEEEAKSS